MIPRRDDISRIKSCALPRGLVTCSPDAIERMGPKKIADHSFREACPCEFSRKALHPRFEFGPMTWPCRELRARLTISSKISN